MFVKHFLACGDSELIHPNEPSRHVLRGVGFRFFVPADAAFPETWPRVCLFTRFYNAIGSHRFLIRVIWESETQRKAVLRWHSIPLEFSREDSIRDVVFTLKQIAIPGPSTFEFRLTTVEQPKIILAREYVWMESK